MFLLELIFFFFLQSGAALANIGLSCPDAALLCVGNDFSKL